MFCQLLLFVRFCQKQNRIRTNKQTSSLAAGLLFTKRSWQTDGLCECLVEEAVFKGKRLSLGAQLHAI